MFSRGICDKYLEVFSKRVLIGDIFPRSNYNLECWFLKRGENGSTRRKTSRSKERTNNKLNPHMTPGPRIEPRPHWWEASALTTTPPLNPEEQLETLVTNYQGTKELFRQQQTFVLVVSAFFVTLAEDASQL